MLIVLWYSVVIPDVPAGTQFNYWVTTVKFLLPEFLSFAEHETVFAMICGTRFWPCVSSTWLQHTQLSSVPSSKWSRSSSPQRLALRNCCWQLLIRDQSLAGVLAPCSSICLPRCRALSAVSLWSLSRFQAGGPDQYVAIRNVPWSWSSFAPIGYMNAIGFRWCILWCMLCQAATC